MKIRATLATALAALALSGAVRAQTSEGGTATLPDKLDLKSAILYALDHNYTIRQAREQIRVQEGVILQVESQRIPNVVAIGQYQRNASDISSSSPPETSSWAVELKATQALYAGGGIDSSVKGARLAREAALYDLQATINAALLDVRTRFLGVLLAREKVRVQEDNIELYTRQLKDTENQFHAGTVSNFEVLRSEVSLANAQPDLITARNNYRIGIEQLRQALGVPAAPAGVPVPFPEVVGALDFTPETYEADSALSAAHANRPELLRIAKLQESGEQAVVVAKSTYYPNLSAFGAYEWVGAGLKYTNVNENGWLVGLQSSWSIFDGRATAGRVRQASSQLEQAKLTYASAELGVEVEVRQALSSLQEAAELVAASRKTVEQADEALRLANARYHAGSATQLDVLTSQVSLTQARTNVLQASYNYTVALASMRKAVGLGDAFIGR